MSVSTLSAIHERENRPTTQMFFGTDIIIVSTAFGTKSRNVSNKISMHVELTQHALFSSRSEPLCSKKVLARILQLNFCNSAFSCIQTQITGSVYNRVDVLINIQQTRVIFERCHHAHLEAELLECLTHKISSPRYLQITTSLLTE